ILRPGSLPPNPHLARLAPLLSQSAAHISFFSRILGVWGSNPILGPSPAYSQPPQSLPYCLIAYHSLRQAGLRAHLGSQLQCPKRGLLAEVAGAAVQYRSQRFSLVCIESPLCLLRIRAWARAAQ